MAAVAAAVHNSTSMVVAVAVAVGAAVDSPIH